ncbi:hypothetical protein V8F44DRAFT_662187 [Aspergillus fumigatus]
MTQPTLIIDTEGEVIIFLKYPKSLFAPWNEDVADPEPLESHGDVQKTDSSNNATQEGIHNKLEMDESTDNPAETLELADTTIQSAAEIVDDSVTKSANGPTTEPLDEQLQEARLDASLDSLIENGREIDFKDLKVFLILMNIFYLCLELLAKIAVLADLRFFAEIWIGHLRRNIFPTIYSCDSMLWVQLFEFKKSTSIAISQSNGLITSLDLPIPAKIITSVDAINRHRNDIISAVLSSLAEQQNAFLDGRALTKHMHLSGLLSPKPAAPFPSLSILFFSDSCTGDLHQRIEFDYFFSSLVQ